MNRIASSTPGRVRIRDLALRNPTRMERVESALDRIDGIHDIVPNAAAGSIVLHYDATAIEPDELEHRIDAIVDAALAAPGKPGRHKLRRQANRAAKIGMLGSLGASLALCLAVDHASMAALVWVMGLAASALAVAFTLTWRPRWLAALMPWVR